jgi:hypothetical protein
MKQTATAANQPTVGHRVQLGPPSLLRHLERLAGRREPILRYWSNEIDAPRVEGPCFGYGDRGASWISHRMARAGERGGRSRVGLHRLICGLHGV